MRWQRRHEPQSIEKGETTPPTLAQALAAPSSDGNRSPQVSVAGPPQRHRPATASGRARRLMGRDAAAGDVV
ncbi:hypothetical protein PACID_06480 [Acidipropionibacterium acidipropionici ATCC 4875]|uniref:Uncharacterized protein n=1 Tax=Acidipropionibacterium acidipropionici (strain ATCC 4875 / DSM 20272 / JCM 6432 / NBRC 12425 / NCIMB 8070 / 4) TaxID=1171373 RepID=K7S1Q4_ACIA4|nr:hypothetical protein PACID_06480 [Acidipropionibacterium acidipropionici ATCC 4875]